MTQFQSCQHSTVNSKQYDADSKLYGADSKLYTLYFEIKRFISKFEKRCTLSLHSLSASVTNASQESY